MPSSNPLQTTAFNALKASTVVSMGEISYFVGNIAEVRASGTMILILPEALMTTKRSLPEECDTAGAILPAVVLELNDQGITKHAVLERFEEFARRDDVFHMGFTEGSVLILRSDELPAPTPALPEALTEHLNLASSKLVFISSSRQVLPEGPYFLQGRTLHRAWRLYPDTSSAFTLSVIPAGSGERYKYVVWSFQ